MEVSVHLNWEEREPNAFHVAFLHTLNNQGYFECDIYPRVWVSAYVHTPDGKLYAAPSNSLPDVDAAKRWCQDMVTAVLADRPLPPFVTLPF